MLIQSDNFCGTLSTSYLRSILDCAYAFGGTAGILWGWLADRMGRRPVALMGLFGMFTCCTLMGFATNLASCAIFRFLAGVVSSSVTVMALTMIGDVSRTAAQRAAHVAMLPLISALGNVGPVVQGFFIARIDGAGALWEKFPLLGSQLACGSVVFLIAVTGTVLLEETLPLRPIGKMSEAAAFDSEKDAFLGQELEDCPAVHVVDSTRPDPISISQFLQAPSLLVLLASFSLLSLHSSTFDALLPHLGHTSTQHGGMGIRCDWLGFTVCVVKIIAALAILHTVPKAVAKMGLLQPYRNCSLVLPALYILTPLLAFAVACAASLAMSISIVALLVKHMLIGGATVLVSLLMLNTAPDTLSIGTVVGLMQIAQLFRALAVGVSGASFYLSDDLSVATTNYALWTCLALFGGCGAALAWFVRDRPSVEQDFPADVLTWETCYDADEAGIA